MLGAFGRAHLDDDLGLARRHEPGDGRVGGHAGVDAAAVESGDERLAGARLDGGVLAGIDAGAHGEGAGEEVGRRTGTGDTELGAAEVGRRGDRAGPVGGDDFGLAWDVGELHDALDALALGLQVDGVVVEADDAIDVAGDQHVLGLRAGGFGEQVDVESLLGEVAELLGELGRQVDHLLDPADHDADVLGVGGRGRRHRTTGCRR